MSPADRDRFRRFDRRSELHDESGDERDHGFAGPGRVGEILFRGTDVDGLVSVIVADLKAQKLGSRSAGGSQPRREETKGPLARFLSRSPEGA